MTDADIEKVLGDDYIIEGQIGLFDAMDNAPKPMIAVSKVFSAAIKQMNLKEWKTFVFALTKIRWKETNSRLAHLPKWELVDILGIKSDPTDVTEHLKRDIGGLPKHSFIEIDDKDRDFWESGVVVTRTRCYKDFVLVCFNEDYMPLFQELDRERNYVTLWSEDLFKMTSERSILFYESLRLHSDTRMTNTRIYGIRDLKRMFGIPMDGKGSYMRKDGHFDRPAFERYVIDPICRDLEKCAMINLHILDDGKPWRKVKYHGRVRGYEFAWDVTDRPAVATAAEVARLKEKIDKNPKVLKIAKNIVDGQEKPKKKNENTHNFDERETDYNAIQAALINSNFA